MDLLTLRDIHGLQLSPDGKYVAFVLGQAVYATNHYRSGLFVVGTEKGSKPISLGTAGPPRWTDLNEWPQENPVWSPDSRYIYRAMKNDGSWQVWRWVREGGAPVQVTHAPHNVQNVSLSPDRHNLVLTVETPTKADRKKLYEHGILYDGSFDATGQSIIDRLVAIPGGEGETWIYSLAQGSLHQASPEERKAMEEMSNPDLGLGGDLAGGIFTKKEIEQQNITAFEKSPDRKRVAYVREETDSSKSDYATSYLLLRSMDGGMPVTLAVWPSYAGEFWWSADSKDLYFTEDDSGDPADARKSKIMTVPASGGVPHPVLETGDFLRLYSTDRTKRVLACIRESDSTPGDIAMADLSTGETRSLVEVNPELKNLQINRSQRIDVFDKSGNRYWGHLVLPTGYQPGNRYPLVITTYADYGGFLRGGTGDEYPIHVFAANGFAVLNFDAMIGGAHNAHPADYSRTLLEWQSPMEAMEAAVKKLDGTGIIDRSRVAITGLSHGAELVNFGISHTDLFRAAIASGGGWDPIWFYTWDDSERDMSTRAVNLGSPEGDSAPRWQKLSTALNATHIHTPLLINAADAEYFYFMQTAVTLRDLKKPFEMFIYPDERHEKNQPRHRYSIYERNVDWLNFWLRDKEDPDPAKSEQYTRWRELHNLQQKDRQQSTAATH